MPKYKLIRNRKIKIALVGCGRISKNHIDSIKKYEDDFELVSVCDINPLNSKFYSDQYNIPSYLNLDEMLKTENLDLVSLCTPSGLHSGQTILAARFGVNVISEKPMATNWEDGVKMVKVCDENNVRLFVVKQNRYNPTLQLLKKALEDQRFGKIYMVHLNVFWTRPQSYYDQDEWRGTWNLDGGALMNQASHYIDLLNWLIGPVEKVQAMMATLARKIEAEDTGVINLKWKSGALGSMSVTMLTYPKNLEGSITILGEKGSVKIAGVALNKIEHWDFSDKKDYDEAIKKINYQITSVYGNGHSIYYQNVIDVFRGQSTPETDGKEGLKSLELLIAAYLSANSEKTISLPLTN